MRAGNVVDLFPDGHDSFIAICRSISSNTDCQLPRTDCLKSFIVGYQGLSDRFKSHRQSGIYRNATQTGRANAPAKCALLFLDMACNAMLGVDSCITPYPQEAELLQAGTARVLK